MCLLMNNLPTEILICCPSRGRAKTCITHKVLPSVKYFVGADEYDQYVAELGAERVVNVGEGIQMPPNGKCRCLNWILDNYKRPDNVILFTDDDILKIVRIDFTKPKTIIPCPEQDIVSILKKMSVIARGMGAKIGGFAALSACSDFLLMGLNQQYRLIQTGYIDGKAFIIFDDDGTRYDENLWLKEDIDFNCQSLKKNKCTLSAKFICFQGKALTNKGGVCDSRTNELEMEQGRMMIEKHGNMLKLNVSNVGNGVRKNAVQFGLNV